VWRFGFFGVDSYMGQWGIVESLGLGLILTWGSGEKLNHWVEASSILRAPVSRVVACPAARTARTAYRSAPAWGRTASGITFPDRQMTAAPPF